MNSVVSTTVKRSLVAIGSVALLALFSAGNVSTQASPYRASVDPHGDPSVLKGAGQ